MTNIKLGVSMELLSIIPLCIIALMIVVGGYVYMFLHVMRCDPRELEFRENLGQDSRLVPHTYK